MPLLNAQQTCLLIDNGALTAAFVRATPAGVRIARGPCAPDYLDPERTLDGVGNSNPITLIIPGAWCAVRQMPLSIAQWEKSRKEIAASIDSIFPLEPGDALLQFIELSAQSNDQPPSGALIAVSRAKLAPWLDKIERDTGRAPDRIISTHAALPGLGLQTHARAVVHDVDAVGAPTAHLLESGRITALDDPSLRAQHDAHHVYLPGAAHESGESVSAHDLAASAAIAQRTDPGRTSPFTGKRTAPFVRFALPTAIAAAAVVILTAAGLTDRARLQAGLERLDQRQAQISGDLEQVQQARERAEQLTDLLARVDQLVGAQDRAMLGLLAEGHTVVPPDGYIYRASFTPQRVELRGQCAAVGDLLRNIESSALLTDGRRVSPSGPVGDGGSFTFDVAASVAEHAGGAQ